ncbi:enoyl-CoA hydratase [Thalassobacillus pellis]|uniref:enoyl-CoA hydratase n=1 Tax=Thalassobacillus pellis TaxID=748008 RepID=UPI001961E4C8|nr:enoyl-CoA hydratase/carnithine racemase [Thalassobacillus pellis]
MNYIELEQKDNVYHLRLAREERYNALHAEMLAELAVALEEVEKSDVQLVVISGKGNGFCAGGDVAMMEEVSDKQTYDKVMSDIETIVTKLYLMPKITIAAIHGPTVGLGLSIALAADYIVADPNALVSMNFIGIGLIPDGGGHFWLKERLGTHLAKKFAWEGEDFHAKRAFDFNLVDQVAEGNLEDVVDDLVEDWLKRPLKSMIATKEIYHQYQVEKLKHYLEKERKAQWELRHSKDHEEGVRAFLEKRKPKFTGE